MSENDIPLETVTGEPDEDNNVDYDEAAEAPENEATNVFEWEVILLSIPTQLFSD